MTGKRVLVTGHDGYIGSVLTPMLLESGYDVVGIDSEYYHDCSIVPEAAGVPGLRKDIRDLGPDDLAGFDAVIHLAALSNDPIGNLNEEWTDQINRFGSSLVAQAARLAGVQRFLYSSSCIMYGMSEAAVVNEDSPLDPKTSYAASKVAGERAISHLAADGFSPTFLRNGTVYGLSPRMRFDTVLNNLAGSGVSTGKVVLHGDGTPWRPVVHVRDVSRAFIHLLEAPIEDVHNRAFNVGEDSLNCQIIELAEAVLEAVPGSRLERLDNPDADQRTYRTDFSRFATTFPDFKFRWSVAAGARDLCNSLREIGITADDFVDRRFTRLKWLSYLLDNGRLDGSLRWRLEDGVVR